MNSVTGEPIARALVRIYGVVQRSAFTDSEGHFQIDGLPAGSTNIALQKPGYSSPEDSRENRVVIGADTAAVVLKLSPLGAIYGHVLDVAGQPIENEPVRLIGRSVSEGRRRWNLVGSAQSDEDGRFRFPCLAPGSYYLAAGPGMQSEMHLARDPKSKTGFPSLYYPNAPDLNSASAIQLVAGQQAEADFSLSAVPVYKVSGTVTNFVPGRGVVLQVFNQLGDPISIAIGMHMDGSFDIEAVPAGTYMLKAFSHVGDQTLRSDLHLSVAANVDNVNLVLAPMPVIPIKVRMESRDASNLNRPGWNQQRTQVSVRLIPTAKLAEEPRSNLVQQAGQQIMALQDVEPGKYTAEVMPWGPWYVQSAQYGPTNLLSDDVTIAPGQTYPIEIVLHDDGATLTGNFQSSKKSPQSATTVVVPQPASRRSVKVAQFSPQSGFTITGLAPGDYLVFAFDHVDKIEYTSPDALQPYASQATPVALSPNQETHVGLTLIRTGEGE